MEVRRKRVRRLLAFAVPAVGLALAASAAAGPASDDEARAEFERIDGAVNYSGFKPASLDRDRTVKVILELAGDSVGEAAAEAEDQGGELSARERESIQGRLERQQAKLEAAVKRAGGEVLADYQFVYNGVAAEVALRDLLTISRLPAVVKVHPVRAFQRDNIPGAQYVRAHETWGDTGFTGDGVQIAVIDTGVDYTHADFGGPGTAAAFASNNGTVIEPGTFPTPKVVGGFDLVGDAFVGDNTPVPDPDPLDCNGHGTHVSGTAAGFGVLSNGSTYTGLYNAGIYGTTNFSIGPGTAPEADILAIRVFGCQGFTTEDILVDALDTSFELGADVVNMSLGSSFGRDDEPSVVSSNTLSENGVVVVASAGNSGPSAYITGAPARATRALSVAAIDASGATFPGATMVLSTGPTITVQNSNGAALPSGAKTIAVLRNSYPSGPVSLGCDPNEYLPQSPTNPVGFPGGVANKIVVTVRGVCARVARAIFGQQAGAAAVAMVNTATGFPPFEGEITSNPDTGEPFTVTIPFLGVRGVLGPAPTADGDQLVAADGGTATLTATTVPNPGFQRLAGFSSGGPGNVGSDPKPEITAPGVSVLSANVGSGNGGTRLSGTSMAAPHTAGVAALVTEAHATWPTDWIKSAMINTANASTSKILAYEPRRAGSGVVDARRAVDTVGVATTSGGRGTLAYGYEPLAGAYSELLPMTIRNTGGSPITYSLSTAFTGLSRGLTLGFSQNPVTVSAGGTQTVNVTATLTAAQVAALPFAAASNFGGLAHIIRGAVVATPTTSPSGVYPLRVPFGVVPRGLSNVTNGPKSPFVESATVDDRLEATVPLANGGIHAGTADVYAWGIQDANDVTGAEDGMDVRSVGVQTLPGEFLGGAAEDRTLVFAVNVFGQASNPSVNEFDIAIDTDDDEPGPEFFVVGVDFGAVTAGSFDGRFASIIFDAAGNLINAWVAEAPMNGSTVLLPTLASDIGLVGEEPEDVDEFSYSVAAFSLIPGGIVDTTGTALFNSHEPTISTGDFFVLPPGGGATLDVWVGEDEFEDVPSLGWLVVTHDDANGAPQANTIPVGLELDD